MGDVLSITNQETDTTGNHKQDEIFTTNLPPKVDKNGSVSRIGHSTENRPQEFSVCGGGLWVHPMTLWKKNI
ncbi:hypothetical protein [Cardinium endosymbiont of Tipula unca]|uniref:hypothetical protein n=1 Tax=Cardinium endosymbiont of Tipula unca TaxID=3066216 RepID=UPI0030CF8587